MQFIKYPNNDQAPAIARDLVRKEITQNSILDIILTSRAQPAWGKQTQFTELWLGVSINMSGLLCSFIRSKEVYLMYYTSRFFVHLPMGALDELMIILHLQWSIYHFLSFCRSPNFFSSSIFRRVLGTNFYNNRDHNTDMMEENSREYLFSVQTIHSKCTLLTFLDSFYYINGCFLNQKCP